MKTRQRTIATAALLAGLATMGQVACEPTDNSGAQSNDVTEASSTCKVPRILFVVDASSSMLDPVSAGAEGEPQKSKWEALGGAIEGLTSAHADTALFGLMTFPGAEGGCSAGDMLIEPGAENEEAINQVIGELPIANDAATPAGQTLVKASQNELLLDPAYDNYVVFISDGWQYCSLGDEGAPKCAAPEDCSAMGLESCASCNACQLNDSSERCELENADGCYCVRNWPVVGAQALADAGVKTYVVGFGDHVDALTLNQTAHIGGDPLPDCDPNSEEASCYLRAESPDALAQALDSIMLRLTREPCEGGCGISGKRTCTLAGWSECQAATEATCTSQCGTAGVRECVDGNLTACSARCDPIVGSGGSAAGVGGSVASAGSGGTTTGSAAGGTGGGGAPAGSEGGQGGAGGETTGGVGGWPGDGESPWQPPEDSGGDEPSGGAAPSGPSPTDPGAEGACAYAPAPTSPSRSAALFLLGAAGMVLTRRRGQGVSLRSKGRCPGFVDGSKRRWTLSRCWSKPRHCRRLRDTPAPSCVRARARACALCSLIPLPRSKPWERSWHSCCSARERVNQDETDEDIQAHASNVHRGVRRPRHCMRR